MTWVVRISQCQWLKCVDTCKDLKNPWKKQKNMLQKTSCKQPVCSTRSCPLEVAPCTRSNGARPGNPVLTDVLHSKAPYGNLSQTQFGPSLWDHFMLGDPNHGIVPWTTQPSWSQWVCKPFHRPDLETHGIMGQGWFEHLIWMKSLEGFYCKSHLAREAPRVL